MQPSPICLNPVVDSLGTLLMFGLAYATVIAFPLGTVYGLLYANTLIVLLMKLLELHVPAIGYTAFVICLTWQVCEAPELYAGPRACLK